MDLQLTSRGHPQVLLGDLVAITDIEARSSWDTGRHRHCARLTTVLGTAV
jgi:hypothetical protein